MPPRSRPVGRTTASPACVRTMGRSTMPPSPSIPTATASRPIAGSDRSRKRLAPIIASPNLEAMTTHTVETATAAEEAAVFAVLTLAFGSDPATRWTWPDPRAYLEAFPHFAKAFGGAAFAAGGAHRIGSAGAALWLPPGVGPDDAAIGALMQRTADVKTAVDGPQIMQQMARY